MSLVENKLLSKLLDEDAFEILSKYNLTREDFYLQNPTYLFICGYVDIYKKLPDYRTVVAECVQFEYLPDIADAFPYLAKTLKHATARRKAYELLQKEASQKFTDLDGVDFVEWLYKEISIIRETVMTDSGLGSNFATNGEDRKQTYLKRKHAKSTSFIPTPYATLNNYLNGGMELTDYVLVQAETNRGKSWLASDMGINAWVSGFGILHYSPELSAKQQLDRLDTLLGHYSNSLLKTATLENEESYFTYLQQFNAKENKPPYIVKTMTDLPKGLSVATVEADLQQNSNIKMVIIDGFNLMSHKGRDGKRNSMTDTSRRLRQVFGKYEVVGVVVHHSKDDSKTVPDGEIADRIVTPPNLNQYTETKAVTQDASIVLGFDSSDGVGKLLLAKSRTAHVNKTIELHCDYDRGYIKEVELIDYF